MEPIKATIFGVKYMEIPSQWKYQTNGNHHSKGAVEPILAATQGSLAHGSCWANGSHRDGYEYKQAKGSHAQTNVNYQVNKVELHSESKRAQHSSQGKPHCQVAKPSEGELQN